MKLDLHQRAGLVIAHPGHELRVYGWLAEAHPIVCILTDGSGSSGLSRLPRSKNIIAQVGARPGEIFGRFTDAAIYKTILESNIDLFCRLVDELSVELNQNDIDYVVGDASEGYNPVHDLCRLIINAAVRACWLRSNRAIANFDFPLIGRPDAGFPSRLDQAIQIDLDETQFHRKMTVAKCYSELRNEIEAATEGDGVSLFRKEYLWPVCQQRYDYVFAEPPFYERYGERQVAAGVYQQVLRYHEHLLPIADALRRHVT